MTRAPLATELRYGLPIHLLVTALFVLGVVALASWFSAWRAARVEPIEALREG